MSVLGFLVSWIPFLGRLFPSYRRIPQPPATIPEARVAIVGAGVGGCSAAYFLRKLGGENLDIHVWQREGSPVGGRTAVIKLDGHSYESGGAVIHSSNKYLVDFAKEFGKNCIDFFNSQFQTRSV